MKRHATWAASAVFFVAVLGSAQAAAPKGYTLPTRDGRCAMWITAEADPPPGESTTWSGDCRDGLGQGFGIQEFVRADRSRLRYVGHVRDGRWHGLGRLHQFAADGGLLHVVEGVFEHGIEQGVFNELVPEHAQNVPLAALRPPGREVGRTAVQVQQFYADGAAVLMCAPDADCSREAVAEGYTPRPQDLGGELNRALPYGGWRFELRNTEQSARTGQRLRAQAPIRIAICLEAAQVRPGREPRVGTLLFPSFNAWQSYLRNDQRCDDLSATQDGQRLRWTSQCQSTDGAERVRITQVRTAGEQEMFSETEVVLTRGGRDVSRTIRRVTARFVGACTADMKRAGQLGL